MPLRITARRMLAVGATAGFLAIAGSPAAHADTPPAYPTVFAGGGTGATAAAAEAGAEMNAAAQQSAFEMASGAMCADTSSTVKSFMVADGVYDALAMMDAMCTAPAPSGS